MKKTKQKTEKQEKNTKEQQPTYLEELQRLQAEFQNYIKRTEIEKETLRIYAKEDLILKLLDVVDNFQRAIEAIKDHESEEAKGVKMISNQLKDILTHEGVTEIEAKGQKFDPNLHEALMKEGSEEGNNIVIEEFQKGYKYKEKVIRPTKVKVSGGKQNE